MRGLDGNIVIEMAKMKTIIIMLGGKFLKTDNHEGEEMLCGSRCSLKRGNT